MVDVPFHYIIIAQTETQTHTATQVTISQWSTCLASTLRRHRNADHKRTASNKQSQRHAGIAHTHRATTRRAMSSKAIPLLTQSSRLPRGLGHVIAAFGRTSSAVGWR